MCRKVLFTKNAPPTFAAGTRPTDLYPYWLENLKPRKYADLFVEGLWDRMFKLYRFSSNGGHTIFDSDIDRAINETLRWFAPCSGLFPGRMYFIKQENWPKLMDVAKDMVKAHIERPVEYRGVFEDVDAIWIPVVRAALGWVEDNFEDLEDEESEVD